MNCQAPAGFLPVAAPIPRTTSELRGRLRWLDGVLREITELENDLAEAPAEDAAHAEIERAIQVLRAEAAQVVDQLKRGITSWGAV